MDTNECGLCGESMQHSAEYVQPSLQCNHKFHCACLKTYSELMEISLNKDECPMEVCQKVFQDDSIFCCVCHRGDHENVLLLCDTCETAYHIHCLHPPLSHVPDGSWNCQNCAAAPRRRRTNTNRRSQRQYNENLPRSSNSGATGTGSSHASLRRSRSRSAVHPLGMGLRPRSVDCGPSSSLGSNQVPGGVEKNIYCEDECKSSENQINWNMCTDYKQHDSPPEAASSSVSAIEVVTSSVEGQLTKCDRPGDDLVASSQSQSECVICTNQLTGEVARPECCEHQFCVPCLLKWSQRSHHCPFDREVFESIIILSDAVNGTIEKRIKAPSVKKSREELQDERWAAQVARILCCVCQRGDNEEVLLLCDRCETAYHIHCLQPPLSEVPDENWYCANCKPLSRRTSQQRRRTRQLHQELVNSATNADESGPAEVSATCDGSISLDVVRRRPVVKARRRTTNCISGASTSQVCEDKTGEKENICVDHSCEKGTNDLIEQKSNQPSSSNYVSVASTAGTRKSTRSPDKRKLMKMASMQTQQKDVLNSSGISCDLQSSVVLTSSGTLEPNSSPIDSSQHGPSIRATSTHPVTIQVIRQSQPSSIFDDSLSAANSLNGLAPIPGRLHTSSCSASMSSSVLERPMNNDNPQLHNAEISVCVRNVLEEYVVRGEMTQDKLMKLHARILEKIFKKGSSFKKLHVESFVKKYADHWLFLQNFAPACAL